MDQARKQKMLDELREAANKVDKGVDIVDDWIQKVGRAAVTKPTFPEDNGRDYQRNLLLHAARSGNRPLVKYLLEVQHDDASAKDFYGYGVIDLATRAKRDDVPHAALEMVRYLVEDQKLPIENPARALDFAVELNNMELVDYLFEKDSGIAVNGVTPAQVAAGYGNVNLLKHLAEKQGRQILEARNKKGQDVFLYACVRSTFDCVPVLKWLINDMKVDTSRVEQYGFNGLHLAAQSDAQSTLSYLISLGIIPIDSRVHSEPAGDFEGCTALHLAAWVGLPDCVRLLCEAKADLKATNAAGYTPFGEVLRKPDPGLWYDADALEERTAVRIARYLLDKGSEPPKHNPAWPTLNKHCVSDASLGVVQFLVESCKQDVNAADTNGNTPLLVAVTSETGAPAIVNFLLDHKADANCVNKAGARPVDEAARLGRIAIFDALVNRRAKLEDAKGQIPAFDAVVRTDNVELLRRVVKESKISPELLKKERPLVLAARRGWVEVIKFWLDESKLLTLADGATADGRQLQHIAAECNQPEVFRLLVDHGADPMLKDKDGNTPCSLAAAAGNDGIVRYILSLIGSKAPQSQARPEAAAPSVYAPPMSSLSYSVERKQAPSIETTDVLDLNRFANDGPTAVQVAQAVKDVDVFKVVKYEEGSADAVCEITAIFEPNKAIKTLRFSCNRLRLQLPRLCSALLRNETVTSICLSDNHLHPASAEHLLRMLTYNTTLTEIDLSNHDSGPNDNQFDDGAISKLIEGIKGHPCIQKVLVPDYKPAQPSGGNKPMSSFAGSNPKGGAEVKVDTKIHQRRIDEALEGGMDLAGHAVNGHIPSVLLKRLSLCTRSTVSLRSTAASKLKRLPDDLWNLSHLKVLNLSGNELGSLPPSVSKLRNLEKLDVSHNTLQALPSDLGTLSNLKQLTVSGNPFVSSDLKRLSAPDKDTMAKLLTYLRTSVQLELPQTQEQFAAAAESLAEVIAVNVDGGQQDLINGAFKLSALKGTPRLPTYKGADTLASGAMHVNNLLQNDEHFVSFYNADPKTRTVELRLEPNSADAVTVRKLVISIPKGRFANAWRPNRLFCYENPQTDKVAEEFAVMEMKDGTATFEFKQAGFKCNTFRISFNLFDQPPESRNIVLSAVNVYGSAPHLKVRAVPPSLLVTSGLTSLFLFHEPESDEYQAIKKFYNWLDRDKQMLLNDGQLLNYEQCVTGMLILADPLLQDSKEEALSPSVLPDPDTWHDLRTPEQFMETYVVFLRALFKEMSGKLLLPPGEFVNLQRGRLQKLAKMTEVEDPPGRGWQILGFLPWLVLFPFLWAKEVATRTYDWPRYGYFLFWAVFPVLTALWYAPFVSAGIFQYYVRYDSGQFPSTMNALEPWAPVVCVVTLALMAFVRRTPPWEQEYSELDILLLEAQKNVRGVKRLSNGKPAVTFLDVSKEAIVNANYPEIPFVEADEKIFELSHESNWPFVLLSVILGAVHAFIPSVFRVIVNDPGVGFLGKGTWQQDFIAITYIVCGCTITPAVLLLILLSTRPFLRKRELLERVASIADGHEASEAGLFLELDTADRIHFWMSLRRTVRAIERRSWFAGVPMPDRANAQFLIGLALLMDLAVAVILFVRIVRVQPFSVISYMCFYDAILLTTLIIIFLGPIVSMNEISQHDHLELLERQRYRFALQHKQQLDRLQTHHQRIRKATAPLDGKPASPREVELKMAPPQAEIMSSAPLSPTSAMRSLSLGPFEFGHLGHISDAAVAGKGGIDSLRDEVSQLACTVQVLEAAIAELKELDQPTTVLLLKIDKDLVIQVLLAAATAIVPAVISLIQT